MNNHRLEINDLIDSAVNNAVARRNEALASVSDEEAKNVSGGIATTSIPLITNGAIFPIMIIPHIMGLMGIAPFV
ncbi:MAG: hypothetical protein ACKPER_02110, partial [Dolichospermum sp.]